MRVCVLLCVLQYWVKTKDSVNMYDFAFVDANKVKQLVRVGIPAILMMYTCSARQPAMLAVLRLLCMPGAFRTRVHRLAMMVAWFSWRCVCVYVRAAQQGVC